MIHHCHPPKSHWWRRFHVGDIYTCREWLYEKEAVSNRFYASPTGQCGKQWVGTLFAEDSPGGGFQVWRPLP